MNSELAYTIYTILAYTIYTILAYTIGPQSETKTITCLTSSLCLAAKRKGEAFGNFYIVSMDEGRGVGGGGGGGGEYN